MYKTLVRLSGVMKTVIVLLAILVGLSACDQFEEDAIPETFGGELIIHPDDLYIYNNQTSRIYSEANDTIISFDKKTYSTPKNGVLVPDFDGIKGNMGYRPNPGYVGKDSLTYEVCSGLTCKTAKIMLFIEEPVAIANCVTTINPDAATTTKNKSTEIRIHLNDVICPSASITINYGTPSAGALKHYSYFEGFKNNVIIYTPNKNFVGQDSFKYKVYPNGYGPGREDDFQEVEVKITVE